MVSDEEEDESTEDGLVCKRNRATTTEPPAIESAGLDYAENPLSAFTPFESAGDTLSSNTSAAGGVPNQAVDVQSPPPLTCSGAKRIAAASRCFPGRSHL